MLKIALCVFRPPPSLKVQYEPPIEKSKSEISCRILTYLKVKNLQIPIV